MANEITEPGQFVTYGGPQLTLAGSDLASKITSLLTREGSSTTRGWRIFDPAKSDFLNTKKVINPGDVVLVNAKSLPMDFPVQASSGGGGSDVIALSGPAGETLTEFEEIYSHTSSATAVIAFQTGAGSIQYSTDFGASWGGLPVSIPAGSRYMVRVQHPNNEAFSATITLTYA